MPLSHASPEVPRCEIAGDTEDDDVFVSGIFSHAHAGIICLYIFSPPQLI